MTEFKSILSENPSFLELQAERKAGKSPLYLAGVSDSQAAHLIDSVLEDTALVVCKDGFTALRMFRDLSFLSEQQVLHFPTREYIFHDVDTASRDDSRIKVLSQLCQIDGKGIVVTSIDALAKVLPPPALFRESTARICAGQEIDIDALLKKLINAGYTRCDMVEGRGQCSLRGGILDLFGFQDDLAYRIEFFGDEVDSIRTFDPFNQSSVDMVDEIFITPARELIYSQEMLDSLLKEASKKPNEKMKDDLAKLQTAGYAPFLDKYLPLLYRDRGASLCDYLDRNCQLFLVEPNEIRYAYQNLQKQVSEDVTAIIEQELLNKYFGEYLNSYDHMIYKRTNQNCFLLSQFVSKVQDIDPQAIVQFEGKLIGSYRDKGSLLCDDILYYHENGYRVILVVSGENRANHLKSELYERGLQSSLYGEKSQDSNILIINGHLYSGFLYQGSKTAVISEFEAVKQTRKPRKTKKNAINSLADIKPGDYIVHVNHGIGQYLGQELITAAGVSRDYLKVKYGGTDILYVSADQLDMFHKYVGSKEHIKLNKLGGKEWSRVKQKVKESCRELAEELVKLYSEREHTPGHAFAPDTPWQKEFEDTFIYEETPDQLKCISEVKEDMEKPHPMDRLLCGDVGYGKTEVAMRAAFKCVMDGHQVAYLAPTTILAYQHYNTFTSRMNGFGVQVEMLSRFKSPKEQKDILKRLKDGKVDIVIGTHRLLQKDVTFPKLGLLVIDEEQRFGVKHKETLVEMKSNIDVLSMTATPIPRTLNMSMIGIRDMSVIETPPLDRHPIRTYVLPYNPSVIKEAILREKARGGQVYYIHNVVSTISQCAKMVSDLVPGLSVRYAHGRMSETELEEIMMQVQNGDVDVLVCTTIIETGLDIPNVNTMIVEQSDRFGLSQLYQLRGRVGRSDNVAFAYLTYQAEKVLSEVAQKRLIALREFTEFGSGFKIAMRDLEIRGAGNVLGPEQHGHIDNVGYEMYCQLLAEAISEVKGETKEKEPETQVDFSVNSYIPETYITNQQNRIEIYKKIADIQNDEDYFAVYDEIQDRFSTIPEPVNNLLYISLMKHLAKAIHISEIKQQGKTILFYFEKITPELLEKLTGEITKNKNKILFSAGVRPYLSYKIDKKLNFENIKNLLQSLI